MHYKYTVLTNLTMLYVPFYQANVTDTLVQQSQQTTTYF